MLFAFSEMVYHFFGRLLTKVSFVVLITEQSYGHSRACQYITSVQYHQYSLR